MTTVPPRLAAEPAAYLMAAFGTIGALIAAFGHLTPSKATLAAGACTAIGTIVTAFLARPADYAVISGAAGILVQSLVLFNVHWSAGEQAAVIAAVNLIVGHLMMRPGLTPVTSMRDTGTHVKADPLSAPDL